MTMSYTEFGQADHDSTIDKLDKDVAHALFSKGKAASRAISRPEPKYAENGERQVSRMERNRMIEESRNQNRSRASVNASVTRIMKRG